MEDSRSKSAAIRQIARELLDDMELGRLNVEQTVLKALRLARLSDALEQQTWLASELIGYTGNDEVSTKYMGWAGRWTDQANRIGWREPLAQIEARVRAWEIQLQTLRVPDVNASVSLASSNPNEYVGDNALYRRGFPDPTKAVTAVLGQSTQLAENISRAIGIRSKTVAMIYNFVLNTHLQREFSSVTETIFDQYKLQVDKLLSDIAGEVLQKIPSVWTRLAEGDAEAISQALTTCRRIIEAFANALIPEGSLTEEELTANKLTKGRTARYRLRKHILERSQSKSQQERLGRSLGYLYDKVSGGVHDNVAPAEARALFLGTYLLLGEVLTLPEPAVTPAAQSAVPPAPMPATSPPEDVPEAGSGGEGGLAHGEGGASDES